MKVILFFIFLVPIIYSCSPINKQHGYLLEDAASSGNKIEDFNIGLTTKNEIFSTLGSPSVKIGDINNIWIYLISIKQENVFENDDIIYQSLFRFEFDKNNILTSKDLLNKEDFIEIAFSKDKTRVISDTYGITDQLYESILREN